jgi:tRNA nucleotidyltransferase (CCA-adding enzyme)
MTNPAENLEVYLVGGAVRDQIMGIEVKDRDWVVVGSTTRKMRELGFKQVGKDFPVFLHPVTGEEYALARSERKVSPGYHGFHFDSNAEITLEQDLMRRDLTMNAIAMDNQGNIIDPYGGRKDIKSKLIRHVSDAFSEDPVRVLRVARFAARYSDEGFRVAVDTRNLMKKMVADGEIDTLIAERVWQEIHASFGEKQCSRFFQELRDCGALKKVLPEVDQLFGIPQTRKYHPEIDTGVHIMMSLDAITQISDNPMTIFAVLVHDLGKALTPESELPAHRGHEKRGLKPIKLLCDRLHVPARYRAFALKVCEYHLHCHRTKLLKPETVIKVLERFDGFRNPDLIAEFALCCLADKRGRTGHEQDSGEQMELLLRYHQAAIAVDGGLIASELKERGFEGSRLGTKIKKEIRRQRIAAVSAIKENIQF